MQDDATYCGAAGGYQAEAFALCDTAGVGIQSGKTIGGNEWFALFCAEDAMDEISGVRVSHVCIVSAGLTF
jgi:hypothetical protein